jgi:hypothetical protein
MAKKKREDKGPEGNLHLRIYRGEDMHVYRGGDFRVTAEVFEADGCKMLDVRYSKVPPTGTEDHVAVLKWLDQLQSTPDQADIVKQFTK